MKLKSPETRQVEEKLVSTLEHMQSPKVGQDQISGKVRFLCWLATPVAKVLFKAAHRLQDREHNRKVEVYIRYYYQCIFDIVHNMTYKSQ